MKPGTMIPFFIMAAAMLVYGQPSISDNIKTITYGPSVCLTAQAADGLLPPKLAGGYIDTSSDRTKCREILDATLALGTAGSNAQDAIPILTQKFPIAIHVEKLNNLEYVQEVGTFEDWLMTKTMAVKTKIELNAPFGVFNIIDPCSEFIEATQEHDLFDPVYRGSQLIKATVSIRVYFVIYAGACALSKITGANQGTSQSRWIDYFNSMVVAPGPILEPERLPVSTRIPAPERSVTIPTTPQTLTFDKLLQLSPVGVNAEVSLFNGSILIGQITAIESPGLDIDLPGAGTVSVHREVIRQIKTLTN
jgi:hypothetical protein